MSTEHLDVVVIGAGLSGVAAGYHLQKHCPQKRYAILEARCRMGGTWDLFRYPGIRSDSDMATLGFSFRPWPNPGRLGEGPAIRDYIEETAHAYGIDAKIRYGKRVERAAWSSEAQRWTISVRDTATDELSEITASFVFACTGYYDYEQGYTPDFPGRDQYRGSFIHPQHWPEDLAYDGKRVVVIGSGATAVTLVPALVDRAAHVTMLQRSPSYILSRPANDAATEWLRAHLPEQAAHTATRWKNVLLFGGFYAYCKSRPESAKKLLVGEVKKALGGAVDVEKHFTPSYSPWDQRLCLVPDGDLFEALRGGRASIVTDRIERFTERGILLQSGQELEADIVVSATGLVIKFLGGIEVVVDGRAVHPVDTMTYKGVMGSDIPNLGLAVGYTNASWTLKCELSAAWFCRVINHMEQRGYTECRPHNDDPRVEPQPLLDFSSGYVQRAMDRIPKQGSRRPWKLYQSYPLDLLMLRHSPIEDGVLRFARRAG